MGSFFTDLLSFQHETAVYDIDPKRLRFVYNTCRFTTLDEIREFRPELVINAATVKYTIEAFKQVIPALPKDCILSDIASVKTQLPEFYRESGFRFVSTHPMFGPTFASLSNLSNENAIVISESDHLGKVFFKDLYQSLGLNIFLSFKPQLPHPLLLDTPPPPRPQQLWLPVFCVERFPSTSPDPHHTSHTRL